jgi:hypothetical protein
LNVGAGRTVANAVVARVDGTGEVCVYASTAVDVVVDVSGWFTSGFVPQTPARIMDTRR